MINIKKTKCMCINGGEVDAKIEINGETVECVKEMKYLGVVIDHKLKFNIHISKLCSKISKKIGFLSRIRRNLSMNCALTVYNTIIFPHFNYCSSILYIGNQEDQNKLQLLQNRAMRVILKCERSTPIANMLQSLRWLSVVQRLKYNALIMVFKIKQNLYPAYLQHNVEYITNERYQLRNDGDFRLPLYRRAHTQNNLFYKGLQLYNNLPTQVKNLQNLNSFKSRLIFLLQNNYL